MMPIPAHQRANFERTDDAYTTIKGLAAAFDTLRSEDPAPEMTSDAALAQAVVLSLLMEKIGQMQRLRQMEWIGLGGRSDGLTDSEMTLAMGEQAAPQK